MKTILFILLLSTSLMAQDAETKFFMFKMSPLHLSQNTLKAGGEFFTRQKKSSVILFLHAVSNNSDKDPSWLFPYEGGGAEIAYRKYIAPIQTFTTRKGRSYTQGIYFSAFLQGGVYQGDYDYWDTNYDWITQTRTQEHIVYQESAKNLATGFTIGLQQIYWKILSLDLYLGAGYQIAQSSITGTPANDTYLEYSSALDDAGYAGVLPKGGLLIGIYLK